jgi:two-component system cell cycle sensor histidine kinase/response regulator CckA
MAMATERLDKDRGGHPVRAQLAQRTSTERSGTGRVFLVLLVAVVLVGAVLALYMQGRDQAEPWLGALLAVLAAIGVISLFAGAAGLLRFAARERGQETAAHLIDASTDATLVTDAGGRPVFANPAWLDLAGAQGLDDVRTVERVFVGDAELSEAIYRLAQAAREGRKGVEDIRQAVAGQPVRWYRVRVAPLPALGRGRSVWTVTDISRERERQENVFQELQHAIDYLDHAPCGFFSVDAAGDVVYVNATLASWLDQDLAQIGSGGVKLKDILQGDAPALLSTARGKPGEVTTAVLDLDLRRRGGQPVPVRILHKVAWAADGTAGPSRSIVIHRGADAVAGDAGRAAEVRFSRFFNNTPMAIATVDRSGRIGRTNASFARLNLLRTGGDVAQPDLPASVSGLIADADRTAVDAMLKRAAEGQADVEPVDVTLAGKAARSARLYAVPVADPDKDGEAAIVYALDTTEQRALETQFAQSQKMQAVGQLAGGIAHDFNNVLSAIILAADFLLGNTRQTDAAYGDLTQIKQNANRAASLVRQLLAFSKRQTLRPEVLDLGDVLSNVSLLLKRLLGEQIGLNVVHGRDLWPVKADVPQLEQVIVNLAVNARDAMGSGGKLTLATRNVGEQASREAGVPDMQPGDYVLIEVTDTGTGIPPEIRDKIFEPFFTTKEVGKGTGLGLSTVYGIVRQTGGYLALDSTMGVGTTFRIYLPRHIPDAQEVAEAAAAAQAPPLVPEAGSTAPAAQPASDLTGQGTILLVEDEDGLRALNARGLTSRGYTVLQAANGLEALRLMSTHAGDIDLVVSDVVMPEMDGPTLLRELRSRNPATKIVFVSGYAEGAFEKNLPEGEQFAFLPKPFTLKQLVAAVKQAIAA